MSTALPAGHGIALHGSADRLHAVDDLDPDALTQKARCGRRVALVDDDADVTPCRDCYPLERTQRDMYDIWDICAGLDARYNNTIRDTRPLGSIL